MNLAWRTERYHSSDKPRDGDQRRLFHHDRDRVLYTSALRRLGGVTQVVAVHEGHIFHNRLTHTLQVAQLARRLAERLLDSADPEVVAAVGGLDPDVAETAGLCHDLGHPPFGHIAEETLQQLAEKHGADDRFEGNAQSFRIVTKLAIRKENFRGLVGVCVGVDVLTGVGVFVFVGVTVRVGVRLGVVVGVAAGHVLTSATQERSSQRFLS